MSDLSTPLADWLSEHSKVAWLSAFSVGLLVFGKGLDVLGGPAGQNIPVFLNLVGGLLGAIGVMFVLFTLSYAALDLAA